MEDFTTGPFAEVSATPKKIELDTCRDRGLDLVNAVIQPQGNTITFTLTHDGAQQEYRFARVLEQAERPQITSDVSLLVTYRAEDGSTQPAIIHFDATTDLLKESIQVQVIPAQTM